MKLMFKERVYFFSIIKIPFYNFASYKIGITHTENITCEYSLIFPSKPDTYKAKQRSIFERYSLANVTRPEIDLHTMEPLGIQYGSENISRGKHARVTSD